jgi:hypothetical protein
MKNGNNFISIAAIVIAILLVIIVDAPFRVAAAE